MKNFLIIGSVLVFSLNGCASYVKVRLLKPSEFSLGTIKKLAVSNFTISGNIYSNENNNSIGTIATGALINTVLGKRVVNINNNYSVIQANQIFTQKLFSNGHFKIVDKIDEINDGDITKNDLSILRQNIGVEAVIVGSGNYSVNDSGQWVDDITYKNGVKITNKKFDINRRIITSLSYKVINTLNGEIIATKTNTRYDNDNSSGVDEDTAINNLRDWKNIITYNLEELSEQSVKQIAPYYVFEDREVKEGKSYVMKQGFKYAQKGLWEQAKTSWETILKNKESLVADKKEDYLFATYNMGIYNEINNEFDKAEELFKDCYKQSFKSEYIDAQNRVRNRRFEIERLKMQGGIETKS